VTERYGINMSENKDRILHLIMVGILFVSMYLVAGKCAEYVGGTRTAEKAVMGMEMLSGTKDEKQIQTDVENEEKKICIVIDAGHGGADPGKVGVNKALEKDINLEIAKKLKVFLEASDYDVVMTRKDENGLYDEGTSNRKVQDMKRRMEIIEKADPLLVISIHQNSYHEEYVKGAQVFYYTSGKKSRELAEMIQESLLALDNANTRKAKGNSSYYLLKKTEKPIVIVECGFLSNYEEAEKLITTLYQEKMAFQIHMGIEKYVNSLY